ncbi:MAG: class I SAM-dependent methyltransferase [Pseudopedobacter saltans]|uniref:Class I SAM-dependent methyltransferase n=1 Tax=Pseudopedobacter saltans TaxID=151895 RepID=A0A2W5F0S4_9SPHI|nr:MAG: class I SAM-dependent methyltransferase [Pseudopedobacter saltans]
MDKSTLEEIEQRFDNDVERFSNLETAQATTVDARYNMDLITDSIAALYSSNIKVLDIGCGAGNYPVCLLQKIERADVTLVDLSQPMLDKAKERVAALDKGTVETIKGDFRNVDLVEGKYDVIIATAVLHHLRDDQDWTTAFARLYSLLKPNGSLWVFDLVHQTNPAMQNLVYTIQYGKYLTGLKDENYRDQVFAYIEKEDSPRPLLYQLDLLKSTGFNSVDVLHKKLCFASYVGFK